MWLGTSSFFPYLQGCSFSVQQTLAPVLALFCDSASVSQFVRWDVVEGEGHVPNVHGTWLVPTGRGAPEGQERLAKSRMTTRLIRFF